MLHDQRVLKVLIDKIHRIEWVIWMLNWKTLDVIKLRCWNRQSLGWNPTVYAQFTRGGLKQIIAIGGIESIGMTIIWIHARCINGRCLGKSDLIRAISIVHES
jgi:hypothetical protein